MRTFARWVVAVTLCGSVFGVGSVAAGESAAHLFDSGTCFGATSCPCGYVCVTGYCSYRGSSAVPAECSSDSDCRPGCYGQVCVDRRCVSPSSVDASAEAPSDVRGAPPPLDRPGSEDRVVDVVIFPDNGGGIVPVDRPVVMPPLQDVPVSRDTGTPAQDVPPVAQDAGTTATDVPAATDDVAPDDQGRLVQGCGCTVAGASPSRSWWALGLLALGLRRRSRRAR